MPFTETGINGLFVYEPAVFKDNRGYFFESFNENTFRNQGITDRFVQDNQSFSTRGTIRGLHYQHPPYAQSKLIRVLAGAILDVVVDIRQGSPTYSKVFSVELTSENKKQLYIPKGFAHGFSVLSETAEILYKCDNFYNKQSEGGIRYNDNVLKIDWQIEKGSELVSEKDMLLPGFNEHINHFSQ